MQSDPSKPDASKKETSTEKPVIKEKAEKSETPKKEEKTVQSLSQPIYKTAGYYPCLNPDVFNPTDLNAEDWMQASAAMGMKEIIITAHHEGGNGKHSCRCRCRMRD